jgi:hypothetical protein
MNLYKWPNISGPFNDLLFAKTDGLDYRSYTIRVQSDKGYGLANVFAGESLVHQARATNEPTALRQAQEWVDEQEESSIEYDLHAAG